VKSNVVPLITVSFVNVPPSSAFLPTLVKPLVAPVIAAAVCPDNSVMSNVCCVVIADNSVITIACAATLLTRLSVAPDKYIISPSIVSKRPSVVPVYELNVLSGVKFDVKPVT